MDRFYTRWELSTIVRLGKLMDNYSMATGDESNIGRTDKSRAEGCSLRQMQYKQRRHNMAVVDSVLWT